MWHFSTLTKAKYTFSESQYFKWSYSADKTIATTCHARKLCPKSTSSQKPPYLNENLENLRCPYDFFSFNGTFGDFAQSITITQKFCNQNFSTYQSTKLLFTDNGCFRSLNQMSYVALPPKTGMSICRLCVAQGRRSQVSIDLPD